MSEELQNQKETINVENEKMPSEEKGGNKKLAILISCVVVAVTVVALFFGVIKPRSEMKKRYEKAVVLLEKEKYEEAVDLFKTTKNYKDTTKLLNEARKGMREKSLYDEVMNAEEMPIAEAVQKFGAVSDLDESDQKKLEFWKGLVECEGDYDGVGIMRKKSKEMVDNNYVLELNFFVKKGIAYNKPLNDLVDPAVVEEGIVDGYDYYVKYPSETINFSSSKAITDNPQALWYYER